jgi:molybdopterin-binding protein
VLDDRDLPRRKADRIFAGSSRAESPRAKEATMKYGARNALPARVKSVKKGDVMSLAKFEVTTPAEMASVLTTESLEDLNLKPGDQVLLVVKAIHVLPVKE